MANRFVTPFFSPLSANGVTVPGAKLFFYQSGTTDPLDTFSDNSLSIPNANPVVADAGGRFSNVFLQSPNYSVILKDADDVTLWSADPVSGTIDVTGDEFKASQQAVADMTIKLSAGNIFVISSKLYTVVAAQNSASITAPTTNPRKDIVYIDKLTGVVGVTTGAEAGSPVDPTIPDGKLPVARITLATTTTEIADSLIDDIRELNELGAPPSKVTQIVQTQTGAVATGTTTMPIDDSIPQNTEGDEYMTLAITPQSASSRLRIDVVWNGALSEASIHIGAALFRDTTADALAAATIMGDGSASVPQQIVFTHDMASPGTSATTFKVRAGREAGTGTVTFNGKSAGRIFGGVMASSIIITEYLA